MDSVIDWSYKAATYLALRDKTRDVDKTLSKAQLSLGMKRCAVAGDLASAIHVEKQFRKTLSRCADDMRRALMRDGNWNPDGHAAGDDVIRHIATRMGRNASCDSRRIWNVSVLAPHWAGCDENDLKLLRDIHKDSAHAVVAFTQSLERVVWSMRDESESWMHNLIEDMKDAVWLMLQGRFDFDWHDERAGDERSVDDASASQLLTEKREARPLTHPPVKRLGMTLKRATDSWDGRNPERSISVALSDHLNRRQQREQREQRTPDARNSGDDSGVELDESRCEPLADRLTSV